jgi:hypothetical protein
MIQVYKEAFKARATSLRARRVAECFSMNKKTKDMVFQALQNSHKIFFFWRYLQ